jgi:TrmH family RNA methyltransferase
LTDEFVLTSGKRFVESARKRKIEINLLTEKELSQLSDSVTAQGVVAIVSKKLFLLDSSITKKKKSLLVALDQINDPGNLGTIIRTCDWFSVDALLVSNNSVELFSPKVVRATMGSLFHFPIITEVDLNDSLRQLKQENYSIITATLDAPTKLPEFHFPEKTVLVFGNEAHGISAEIMNYADDSLSIKKYGKAESLNVAMACGIFLSSVRQK